MSQDGVTSRNGYHRPVLVDEVVALLAPATPGVIVDATFGGGGHSARLIEEFGDDVTVIAIDRDPEALANARTMKVTAVKANFSDIASAVRSVTDRPVTGVLFDFGVSSHQLDQARRGFSYHQDGPLDMRMSPDSQLTAAEIVNEWAEADIAMIIRKFGEDPMAGRIAAAIVRGRPYESTSQVATVIAEATPAARRRAGHPARRTFQALRMAVNDELEGIRTGLDQAIEMTDAGGRLAAISYHSLEDRIVKRRFAAGARGCVCPPDLPVCGCGETAELRILTRKPVRPSDAEIADNNRARSAILRAAEKVGS